MMQRGKRGQGLPMNVVILAIIVIVVLIILLIILVGGTSKFAETVKGIFSGRVSAQSLELATKDCQQFCESAKVNPSLASRSKYCTYTTVVELDNQLTKVGCQPNVRTEPTEAEKSRGIVAGDGLGVACDQVVCA